MHNRIEYSILSKKVQSSKQGAYLKPDFLKHFPVNKFWWYDLPAAKYALEEWKLQSGFDSDCLLLVIKGATLSSGIIWMYM